MGNKRLFPLLEFSRQPVFPHWQIAPWAWWNGLPHWCTLTSNPAQPAQCTGRQIIPQMRSSACLSDPNFLCPRRTVPICIRQTFDEGVQERLDTSHSESNSSLERLNRKKKGAWNTPLYTNPTTVSVQPSESNYQNAQQQKLGSGHIFQMNIISIM